MRRGRPPDPRAGRARRSARHQTLERVPGDAPRRRPAPRDPAPKALRRRSSPRGRRPRARSCGRFAGSRKTNVGRKVSASRYRTTAAPLPAPAGHENRSAPAGVARNVGAVPQGPGGRRRRRRALRPPGRRVRDPTAPPRSRGSRRGERRRAPAGSPPRRPSSPRTRARGSTEAPRRARSLAPRPGEARSCLPRPRELFQERTPHRSGVIGKEDRRSGRRGPQSPRRLTPGLHRRRESLPRRWSGNFGRARRKPKSPPAHRAGRLRARSRAR